MTERYKILFTLLCIDQTNDKRYIKYCNQLITSLLSTTNHDILVSTNKPEDIIRSNRVKSRNNITEDLKIFTDISEHEERLRAINGPKKFNCTLKFLCFENIPNIEQYDIIFFIDCDCALELTDENENFIYETLIKGEYDMVGARMGDTLGQEWDREHSIYNHKKRVYGKKENPPDPYNVGLPSEHFFILKNENNKIELFASELRRLNYILQKSDCVSWGESYELGISLAKAGYNNPKNIVNGEVIGIYYNYYNLPYNKIIKELDI